MSNVPSEHVQMTITHEIPSQFGAVANRFLLSPERLAYLLCADFALHPPKELIVIESGPGEREAVRGRVRAGQAS